METYEPQAESPKPDVKPTKTEEAKEPKSTTLKNTPKIDSYIKFKAPGDKSPTKRAKVESKVKTPIKIDVLNEVAMPSWSDNSSQDIIKPKATETQEAIVIEDSEDMKLVYEETEQNRSSSDSQSPAEKAETAQAKDVECETSTKTSKDVESETSKETERQISPKTSKTSDGHNFFKQAKVTDVGEAAVAKAVPSPKAPRRVAFVTLSSPKNKKSK